MSKPSSCNCFDFSWQDHYQEKGEKNQILEMLHIVQGKKEEDLFIFFDFVSPFSSQSLSG